MVVNSSGVKVYGEGEWKTRQPGISKRRTWRKLHLGVDEGTGEIPAAVVAARVVRKGKPHQHDENLRSICKHGHKRWKRDSGYYRRSIAETTMFHFKTIFGNNLSARKFDN